MDMVEPDVPAEPLEHLRELEVARAVQGGGRVIPLAFGPPIRIVELMLDVEEPDAGGAAQEEDRAVDEGVSPNPPSSAASVRRPANARFVHRTPTASFRPILLPKLGRRWPIASQIGPIPNITNGFR